MIQLAVWSWYDNLLNSFDQRFPWINPGAEAQPVLWPLPSLKTLLAYGADFHCKNNRIKGLLRGLIWNIVQFGGEERSPEATRTCMSRWLKLVQELGFDLKDYLRTEAEKQRGWYYNLGAGIQMTVCFNQDTEPHIWTIFQGPQERRKNVIVDRISECANWKEWQSLNALPKPLGLPKARKLLVQSAEIIVVQKYCGCSPVDAHLKPCKHSDAESRNEIRLSQTPLRTTTSTTTSTIASRTRRIVSTILYYMISAQRYRHEFTFYVFVLACFFGCSYLARFWIAGGFFLTFKLLQDAISYLI